MTVLPLSIAIFDIREGLFNTSSGSFLLHRFFTCPLSRKLHKNSGIIEFDQMWPDVASPETDLQEAYCLAWIFTLQIKVYCYRMLFLKDNVSFSYSVMFWESEILRSPHTL